MHLHLHLHYITVHYIQIYIYIYTYIIPLYCVSFPWWIRAEIEAEPRLLAGHCGPCCALRALEEVTPGAHGAGESAAKNKKKAQGARPPIHPHARVLEVSFGDEWRLEKNHKAHSLSFPHPDPFAGFSLFPILGPYFEPQP